MQQASLSFAPQAVPLAAGDGQEQEGSADDMEASQDVLTMDDTEDTAAVEDRDMAEPDPDAGMDSGKRWGRTSSPGRLLGLGLGSAGPQKLQSAF